MAEKKILYLDPFSGISGDMLLGAMLDLGLDLAQLHHELSKLNLAGYALSSKRVMRGTMAAMKFDVEIGGELETARDINPASGQTDAHSHSHHNHAHEHESHDHGHSHGQSGGGKHSPVHRNYAQIKTLIENSTLSASVKQRSMKAFWALAMAEGRIHAMPPEQVHFHEVGALDSLIDMVGACVGVDLLGVDEVWCGPLALGSGLVKCQHGVMPVPAPATLEIVNCVPLRQSPVEKELTTPTGAALAVALSARFSAIPPMNIIRIGYGAGSRVEQTVPNVLRVLLGTLNEESTTTPDESDDSILEINTNIDDSSAEVLGYLSEVLLSEGALDVFFTPIQMKKNRPATQLTVLAEPALLNKVAEILFKESSTFGLRYHTCSRLKLSRHITEVNTEFGKVRVKAGSWQNDVTSIHPEFEDCRALALEKQVPVRKVIEAATVAYKSLKK